MQKTLLLAGVAALWIGPALAAKEYLFRPTPPTVEQLKAMQTNNPGAPALTLSLAAGAPLALTGASYATGVTASGPVGSWSLDGAPAWLAIAPNGSGAAIVAGTPPAGTGSFSYVVKAVDAQGRTVSAPATSVTVGGPSAAIVGIRAKVRSPAVFQLATNLPSPTWFATVNTDHLAVSADGSTLHLSVLNPIASRSGQVQVTAQSGAQSAGAGATVEVYPPLTFNYNNNPTLTEGRAVRLTYDGLNFIGTPIAEAEGLPPGLTIDPSTGIITGAASPGAADASPYTVSVSLTDSYDRQKATQTFPLVVTRSPIMVYATPIDRGEVPIGGWAGDCPGVGIQNAGGTTLTGLRLDVVDGIGDFRSCSPNVNWQAPRACGTSLAAGDWCYLGLQGTPRAKGERVGKVRVVADGVEPVETTVYVTGK